MRASGSMGLPSLSLDFSNGEESGSKKNRFRCGVLFTLVFLGFVFSLTASSLCAQEQSPPASAAEEVIPPPAPDFPRALKVITSGNTASRDSLRHEIEKYSLAIEGLRDSLDLDNFQFELSEDHRHHLENSVEDLTLIIESIGGELSEMELEIANNQISLLDAQGEGIVIEIPENLDEHLSQGFEILQQVILSELPEDDSELSERAWSWGFGTEKPEKPQRKILKGNIVKVGDSLQIQENEDVRGNVIVVFGDVEVSGRVDGNVVTVFGNLMVTETAEVTGQVVTVGGRLDQDPSSELSDVVVVDPLPGWMGSDSLMISDHGILGLLMGVGELILVVLLTLLVLAISPSKRMKKVREVLVHEAIPSFWVGLVGTFLVYLTGIILMGVLVLTVIGIPVALLVLVALMLVSVLALGMAGLTLGKRLCVMFGDVCSVDWIVLIVGLVAIDGIYILGVFAGVIPGLGVFADGLVIIGTGIKLVAYLIGMGALMKSKLGKDAI
ncbi:MAG: hypothetical protein GY780_04375 [bacterium]|nr:hypothetical protein [bacterium]